MNMLESLFDWLLATTLRASALAVAIVSVQLLLRRWLPSQWRYALWLPLLLVLALPVLPTVPFGILPKSAPAEAAMPGFIEPVTGETPIPLPLAPAVTASPSEQTKLNPWALLWLSGSAAMLAIGILSYRRNMHRITKHAVAADVSLLQSIEEAARKVGLSKIPRVIVSSEVESPAVTGLLRPSLLLPAGFPQSFNEAEARLILLHELTHLKRLDLPVNGLCCIFQALHWFNPILWLAFARMRADRETACDAQVLSLDQNDHRSDYGHALLKLQTVAPRSGLQLGFVGIFESSSELKNRIREISSHRHSHPAWRAGSVAVIGMLTLFGATKAEERKPNAAPAEPRVTVNQAQPNTGVDAIMTKLKTIVIPVVKFENTSLEEAIDFIRLRSNQLDTAEKDPTKKGINFVIRKPRPGGADFPDPGKSLVTLDLKNATVLSTLTEIAKKTNLRFKVDEFAVTFVPADEMERFIVGPPPRPPEQPSGKAAQAGNEIIIPVVDFEDVSLGDAVEFLNTRAKEISKDKPVFPIVLDPKADSTARIKELRLRNVPLTIAVRYVSEASKSTFTSNDTEIRITRP